MKKILGILGGFCLGKLLEDTSSAISEAAAAEENYEKLRIQQTSIEYVLSYTEYNRFYKNIVFSG